MTFNPWDYYNKKAKQQWFKARAVFKLEELDQKFRLFNDKTRYVLDLWCAPGSWMQYAKSKMKKHSKNRIIGFDLSPIDLPWESLFSYVQDITDEDGIRATIDGHGVKHFDVIMSDAAPNTTWIKDLDAMKSIQMMHDTLPLYQHYLAPHGKFVMKVFMGEWFEELVAACKKMFGGKNIKVYKPDASRKASKEVYIIKR